MSALPSSNPFSVFTPEGLPAPQVVATFTTAMPGLQNLRTRGHAFVLGSRGSGKSILLRYLEPDCQALVTNRKAPSLSHFAFYVSFRDTEVQITELSRFENQHGEIFFNEHLLVLAIAARVTARLEKNVPVPDVPLDDDAELQFCDLSELLPGGADQENTPTPAVAMQLLGKQLRKAYHETLQYVKKHAFRSHVLEYNGYLYGFDDFLLPYLDFLAKCYNIPGDVPKFLFLDDADSLTETQTRVVNSWVARRLSDRISIKIAAQLTAYKTRLTTYHSIVEAPHDYQEINLSDMNTRSAEMNFRSRMNHIVTQRLKAAGIEEAPEDYFPEDHHQVEGIQKETELLRHEWEAGRGRGYRARDDVQRYARPEYIRKLGGTRKSRNSYSYSGFEQLVYISSGLPRFFLEAAADMYDRVSSSATSDVAYVPKIPADVQNSVIRARAQRQFIWDIRDLRKDTEKLYGTPQKAVRLHNLIDALGSMFEAALIDPRASERKYFSFAFSDLPSEDVETVLDLGLRYGYLFKSIIGRKEGIGRTILYVLSRRLAPLFNLDPMGFAAYKFMTNEAVQQLMDNPDLTRRELRQTRLFGGETGQTLLPFSTRRGPDELPSR